MTDKNLERLAKQRFEGEISFEYYLSQFENRAEALRAFYDLLVEKFSRRKIEGQCESCEEHSATEQKQYYWRGISGLQLGKNIPKIILLFPLILFGQFFLPIYLIPNLGFDMHSLQFSTFHNLCTNCSKKIKIGNILSILILVVFGIIMVFTFAGSIILFFLVFFSAIGVGWEPMTLKYFLPAWIITTVIFLISKKTVKRAPVILTIPKNIRKIERGGFESMSHQGTGKLS